LSIFPLYFCRKSLLTLTVQVETYIQSGTESRGFVLHLTLLVVWGERERHKRCEPVMLWGDSQFLLFKKYYWRE